MSHASSAVTRPLDQLRGHSGSAGLDPVAPQAAAGRNRQAAVQHTYEAAARGRASPSGLIVAADHEEIAAAVRGFRRRSADDEPRLCQRHRPRGRGRPAAATTSTSWSTSRGTSRSCPARRSTWLIELLEANPELVMATLATPIRERAVLEDPSCVKVVFDGAGQGAVFQPQPDSARARVARRAAGGRSAAVPSAHRAVRLPPRFSVAAGRACPARRWRNSRTSSNCGCWKTATRSASAWSTSGPWASIRPRITGRLSAGPAAAKIRFQGSVTLAPPRAPVRRPFAGRFRAFSAVCAVHCARL